MAKIISDIMVRLKILHPGLGEVQYDLGSPVQGDATKTIAKISWDDKKPDLVELVLVSASSPTKEWRMIQKVDGVISSMNEITYEAEKGGDTK